MNNPLPVSIFLVLLASLLSTDVVAQALPDPGTDPLQPVDSTLQSHCTGEAVSNAKTAAPFVPRIVVLQPNPCITTDSLFDKQPAQDAILPATKKLKAPVPPTGTYNN